MKPMYNPGQNYVDICVKIRTHGYFTNKLHPHSPRTMLIGMIFISRCLHNIIKPNIVWGSGGARKDCDFNILTEEIGQ